MAEVGDREKEKKTQSAAAESAVSGDRDNKMDRVSSGRIGSDRRYRPSEGMLAWQGGGSKEDTLPTWGVELNILTGEKAGLHQELHQLKL